MDIDAVTRQKDVDAAYRLLLQNAESLEELAGILEHLLRADVSVGPDGRLSRIKVLVARVNGLRVVIHPRDHPPPHFHVEGGGIDASFLIADGSHFKGEIDHRSLSKVNWWYKVGASRLIHIWNQTRPSD